MAWDPVDPPLYPFLLKVFLTVAKDDAGFIALYIIFLVFKSLILMLKSKGKSCFSH